MAKVLGPLLSLSARQTFGKTLTFSVWKGVNTVRLKSNPSNPKTASQMEGRAYFAAGGKISKASDPTETLATFIKTITPAQQSWISYYIAQIMGTNYASIKASRTAYELAGNATIAGYFDNAAADAGVDSVNLGTNPEEQVDAGLALWAAYVAAYSLGSPDAPVVVTSATQAQVNAFTNALTGITPS